MWRLTSTAWTTALVSCRSRSIRLLIAATAGFCNQKACSRKMFPNWFRSKFFTCTSLSLTFFDMLVAFEHAQRAPSPAVLSLSNDSARWMIDKLLADVREQVRFVNQALGAELRLNNAMNRPWVGKNCWTWKWLKVFWRFGFEMSKFEPSILLITIILAI